jgi:hypothetical protein
MSVNISNLTMSRVSAGTSGSTPAASDPYWSSVSLLTETTGNNTQNNKVFLDSSTNNFTITNANLSTTQGTFSPFTSGGSGYFDGSSYLTAPDSAAHNFGTTPFTVEGWFYSTQGSGVHGIIGNFDVNGGYVGWRILTQDNKIYFTRYIPASGDAYSTVAFLDNTWNHFAVVGDGTTIKLYLNGVVGSVTCSQPAQMTSSGPLSIGKNSDNSAGITWTYNGYLSNIRIVKGTALYTNNFTPSTTPLTAITNTSLLLNYTNAGIYDASAKNNMFTNDNTQVSTTQAKFGTTSIKLDGTGDYVSMPSNTDLQIVGGDFTIESWIYATSTSLQQIINQDDGASTNQTFTVRMESNGSLGFIYYTGVSRGSAITRTTSNTIPLNAWTHIAVSKSGDTLKMFINGVQGFSSAGNPTMYQGSVPTTLGAFTNGAYGYNFNGYMQDVRITKGVGRYTTDFTPSAQPFPTN